MSESLARKKRVQAGLSLAGAGLGLAALGTKGGAVATRQALKRAPGTAKRLRLTPKGADKADKASLGLVTTASGVGGASGIHFAALQQAEAKKEDKVSKSLVAKAYDEQQRFTRKHEARMLEQKRYAPLDRDFAPGPQRHLKLVTPPAVPKRTDHGGINPEKRRQTRMKAEEGALAGAAGVTGTIAAGRAANAVQDSRTARKATKRTVTLQRKSQSAASDAWRLNAAKDKPAAAKSAKAALDYSKAAQRSEGTRKVFRAASKVRGRKAVVGGLVTAALGSGSAAVHRSRTKGQGRQYSDWWDG